MNTGTPSPTEAVMQACKDTCSGIGCNEKGSDVKHGHSKTEH